MRILVYGAGVVGSQYAVRLHEAGHDVSLLARGERLASLRRHGVRLAEAGSPAVRRIPVPVVDHPADGYDLTPCRSAPIRSTPCWPRSPTSTAPCCSCTTGRPGRGRWAR
uniref:ketopantoate reductase family protein n=1 Tax=Herbidospora sakaeratensis TaxID=564415 RepID=UPI001FE0638E|nr:2-dehydropantoate 2-reductase N-terminal domain-containing protein [Herbidospora sakaeratensis]